MTQPIAHLVFKTHLDIGFTDYAAEVVRTYFEHFIPQALDLAQRTRDQHDRRFRWTTGAWLIYEYLERAPAPQRHRMEQAIEAGDIQWHALPFTTHTELMDASLFRFGLTYARRLDNRFGRKTIAAKMTDVPGHTRAMIPLLAEAGIRFLHLGVNQASAMPDVPPVFVWRDEASGAHIIVVYEGTYGGITAIPGFDDVLAVTLTGDNLGPPSEKAISQTYEAVQSRLPGAKVIASTLDDYANKLEAYHDDLPVVTSEIGDTWIHGAGTDPTKIRQYRELCRLRGEWLRRTLDSDDRHRIDRFSSELMMIPEHTWGMDEKTHLADYDHYWAADLAKLRTTKRCRHFEDSWAEQRRYIDAALDELGSSVLANEAKIRLSSIEPRIPDMETTQKNENFTLQTEILDIQFDSTTGAINHLTDRRSNFLWADSEHPLGLLTYIAYGKSDYDRFWEQYIRNKDDPEVQWWASEDFTKPGLLRMEHAELKPQVINTIRPSEMRLVFELQFSVEPDSYGTPQRLFLDYRINRELPHEIELVLSGFGKPASRLPEAFWLTFCPRLSRQDGWHFQKLGGWISPLDVVSRGGRGLHAVDQVVRYQDESRTFRLTTLDAPLVAPGKPSLLDFHDRVPDMLGGVHVNLYNNIWGTNFPMWYEDDTAFRFRLQLEQTS